MRILLIEDEQLLDQTLNKGLQDDHLTADIAYAGEEGPILQKRGASI